MRVKVDWRSADKKNYNDFKKAYPRLQVNHSDWKKIIYAFNEAVRDYILETGEMVKLPHGFGELTINKKKRKKYIIKDGKKIINLPVDWIKSREAGKRIYNFNHHTDGYFFGWMWFNTSATIKFRKLWYFKPYRVSSRLIAHYIKVDEKYQHIYKEWKS